MQLKMTLNHSSARVGNRILSSGGSYARLEKLLDKLKPDKGGTPQTNEPESPSHPE